jgi:hypothetical protein
MIMAWQTGGAAALLEAFMPGIVAWARASAGRASKREVAPPLEFAREIARDTAVSAEVLAAFRLPPEAEKTLQDVGMPADDSPVYNGRKRKADVPDEAARKFVIWARAINATGAYPTAVVCALYGECAAADHRVAVSDNRFLFALKHTPGVRGDVDPADRRRHIWTIEPASATPNAAAVTVAVPTAALLPEAAQVAASEPRGELRAAPQPAAATPPKGVPALTPVSIPVSIPVSMPISMPAPVPTAKPATVAKPPLNKPRLLYRFVPDQEYSSPQLVQAKAREARRLGRARKQRGGRSSRRAM